MGRTAHKESKNYVSILSSEGNFRLQVPEGTEGAVARQYEDKDGVEKTKFELVFDSIDGLITDIEIYEGKFGTNLLITLEHDDGKDVISFATATNYGEDMLKKLPNIDLEKPVKFTPYKFIGDNNKELRGVSVVQDGEKIQSYFFDGKKAINGAEKIKMPTAAKGKKISSDKWKAYFTELRLFMLDYAEANIVATFDIARGDATDAVPDEGEEEAF